MNVLCTGHVPRAVGRGGSGVLNTPPPQPFQKPVLIYTPVDE